MSKYGFITEHLEAEIYRLKLENSELRRKIKRIKSFIKTLTSALSD